MTESSVKPAASNVKQTGDTLSENSPATHVGHSLFFLFSDSAGLAVKEGNE